MHKGLHMSKNWKYFKNHPLQTLNQVVKYARLPRYKVIRMLARFIRFGIAAWKYEEERFVFSLS